MAGLLLRWLGYPPSLFLYSGWLAPGGLAYFGVRWWWLKRRRASLERVRGSPTLLAVAGWGAVIGFALPFLVVSEGMWEEYFERLEYAWSGGRGEAADTGEPFFYLVLLAAYCLPGIPIGALTSLLLRLLYRFLDKALSVLLPFLKHKHSES